MKILGGEANTVTRASQAPGAHPVLPRLAPTLMTVAKRRRGLNYGSNKIRFISPVPAGSRIRLRQKLLKAEPVEDNGIRVTSQMTMEVEGSERPAMVAETLSIVYG